MTKLQTAIPLTIASAVLLGLAAFEIARVATGQPWGMWPAAHSYTMSIVLAAAWTGAVVLFWGVYLGRVHPMMAWVATFVTPVSLLAHSFVTAIGMSDFAPIYLPAALLVAFSLGRGWIAPDRTAEPATRRASAKTPLPQGA